MTTPTTEKAAQHAPAYRPDVDGLRALAVLGVILFHAGVPGFPGGYVGVDVFFVISGYLISGIVIRAIERGTFTFRDFYSRRINRIFPALILVLVTTLALGWYLLFRNEFFGLGKHVTAGAGFFSNFALLRETGYFDAAAEKKPLLHLWSLAIEEQFYLFWPMLLAISWRIKPRFAWFAFLAGVASCTLAFVLSYTQHAQSSFYFPLTRLWELIAGFALLYLELPALSDPRYQARTPWLPRSNLSAGTIANLKGWLGLSLILAAIFLLNNKIPWPSPLTVLPVLGSVLVISAGEKSWVNRKLFAHPAAVWVGLISYPLYLWHWPLLSYLRFVQPKGPSPTLIFAAIALSFILAYSTFRVIEHPIRSKSAGRGKRALVLFGLMTIVAGVGAFTWQGRVSPRLDTPRIRAAEEAIADWTYPGGGFAMDGSIRPWTIPGDKRDTVIFAGDSHMEQYWPRAEYLVKNSSGSLPTTVFLTAGGCPMLPRSRRIDWKPCDNFYDRALAHARGVNVRAVVIGSYWEQIFRRKILARAGDDANRPLAIDDPATDSIFAAFEQDIAGLVKSGKRVFVLLSIPISLNSEFDPEFWLPNRLRPLTDTAIPPTVSRQEFVARVAPVLDRVRSAATRGGAEVLDPVEYLCSRSACPKSDSAGDPLYKDSNHLRARIARERATFIDRVYRER